LFCPRHIFPKQRSLGHISDEMKDILLDRIEEYPDLVKVHLVGLGEPLCYPKVFEFLEELRERKPSARIIISSNCILLNEENTRRILDIGVWKLKLSLNLPTRALHKKYTRTDTYDLVKENIHRVLKMRKKGMPFIEIRLMKWDETSPYIMDELKFWGPHLKHGAKSNDFIHVTRLENWMGGLDVKALGMRFLTHEEVLERGWFINCGDLSTDIIVITKEGNLFPCCESIMLSQDDNFNLGNIKDHSIMELTQKALEFKLYLKGTRPDRCLACTKTMIAQDVDWSLAPDFITGQVYAKEDVEKL